MSDILVLLSVFVNKPLLLDDLFSTTLIAVAVTNPVVLGVVPSTSVNLALQSLFQQVHFSFLDPIYQCYIEIFRKIH